LRIAVISDTHDHLENLLTAIQILKAESVTTILHCGDLCGPEVVHAMADFDVWIAEGNMDIGVTLDQLIRETFGAGRFSWLQRIVLDGYSIAMIHGDDEAALGDLIFSGQHAYVFHGHTHRRRDRQIGQTRVINPGALGSSRYEACSFCILDLETDDAQFVILDE